MCFYGRYLQEVKNNLFGVAILTSYIICSRGCVFCTNRRRQWSCIAIWLPLNALSALILLSFPPFLPLSACDTGLSFYQHKSRVWSSKMVRKEGGEKLLQVSFHVKVLIVWICCWGHKLCQSGSGWWMHVFTIGKLSLSLSLYRRFFSYVRILHVETLA